MVSTPPVVISQHADGIAYLLEFQEPEPGVAAAEISYLAWEPKGGRWAEKRAIVPESDLTRIEGQNYLSVPSLNYADTHRLRQERGDPGA